jgi:ubiquitin fusion degradation protein 1
MPFQTDCEVDFAPPLDYVEPVPVPKPQPQAVAAAPSLAASAASAPATRAEPEPPRFTPFAGTAKRLVRLHQVHEARD